MSISYSGLVNYGKATLPAVESWSTNNNVVRDPPRAITTRMVERVGDTMDIVATLAESGDRYCEAINYYARSVNPSVAVSYGEAGSLGAPQSGGREAFLPYRVVRDGVFRPPVRRQQDLLPLSRLPRNWTSCEAKPFFVNYANRAFNCGTAETTREVKDALLRAECETRKTIDARPQLTAPPLTTYMLKDPLAPGTVDSGKCAYAYGRADDALTAREIPALRETRPMTWQMTNPNEYGFGRPTDAFDNRVEPRLRETRPTTAGSTNAAFVGLESAPMPHERMEWTTTLARAPGACATTNRSGAIFDYEPTQNEYDRLLPRNVSLQSYFCNPGVPTFGGDVALKRLTKVR